MVLLKAQKILNQIKADQRVLKSSSPGQFGPSQWQAAHHVVCSSNLIRRLSSRTDSWVCPGCAGSSARAGAGERRTSGPYLHGNAELQGRRSLLIPNNIVCSTKLTRRLSSLTDSWGCAGCAGCGARAGAGESRTPGRYLHRNAELHSGRSSLIPNTLQDGQ